MGSATAKAGLIVADFDVQYNHYVPGLFFKPEDEGGKRVENRPWPSGYVKPRSDKVKRERVDLIDMIAIDMLKQEALYKTSKGTQALKPVKRFSKYIGPIKQSN